MATNLENMENLQNSGNLKNYQNLRENSGKTQGNLNFCRKTWKTQGKCGIIADENVFQRIISSEILREKFENDLEISGKTQGI